MGLILENAFKEDPQESQLLLTENKSKKNSAWKYSTYKKEGGSPTFFVFFFFFPPDIDKWNRISFGVHSW